VRLGTEAPGLAAFANNLTKLWNNNHRPERVQPAFESSRERLQLEYIDSYLMHTPYAFRPGDDQDPRDENGNVIYDEETTLMDTWEAMEDLVGRGMCKAIGLSDIGLDQLQVVFDQARIKPAVVQIESHPYLPETQILEFCKKQWNRDACLCAAGSRDHAGGAGRSRHRGDCPPSQ
jgi:alcohol dehydrogenase (NADP+)